MGIIEKSLMQNKHSPPSQQQQHRLGSRLLDQVLLGHMDQEPQPQQLAGDKYLAFFNKQIELSLPVDKRTFAAGRARHNTERPGPLLKALRVHMESPRLLWGVASRKGGALGLPSGLRDRG